MKVAGFLITAIFALAMLYILSIILVVLISWVFGIEPVNLPWGMQPQSEWKWGVP